MDDKRKTPWGLWVGAGLFFLPAYPLSEGPLWVVARRLQWDWAYRAHAIVYAPLFELLEECPPWLVDGLSAYEEFWVSLAG